MFESMTYENILNDMLDRVTNDIDKREGAVIYDALAPCAFQLAQAYFQLDNFIDLVLPDTAVGEYLDRAVSNLISRKQATYSIRKLVTNIEISLGTRWGLQDTSYIVIEKISSNEYKASCEQLGTVGNIYNGLLENIDNVSGVTASLTDIITSGTDVETDDNLRNRFYAKSQTPSTSGNVDNYKEWTLEVEGVGSCKVYPLWNGNGTIKILIVNSNMDVDESLEEKVYKHIEEVRPIGVSVTVDSPEKVLIDISANIELDNTKSFEEVIVSFNEEAKKYLKETVFTSNSISYAKVGSLLFSTPGVKDYTNLLINQNSSNITLLDDEIPSLNDVVLSEVVV